MLPLSSGGSQLLANWTPCLCSLPSGECMNERVICKTNAFCLWSQCQYWTLFTTGIAIDFAINWILTIVRGVRRVLMKLVCSAEITPPHAIGGSNLGITAVWHVVPKREDYSHKMPKKGAFAAKMGMRAPWLEPSIWVSFTIYITVFPQNQRQTTLRRENTGNICQK